MLVKDQAVVTNADAQRLRQMIASFGKSRPLGGDPFHSYLRALENQLEQSSVVSQADVGPDVVTMNSKLCLQELDSGKRQTVTLVYPDDGDLCGEEVSVLTPLGASLLGARVGTAVEWTARRSPRRARIDKVLFQPEAAGEFDL